MLGAKHEAAVQKIVEDARMLGAISYEELNDRLPASIVQADDIDAALSRLEENGIEIIEETEYRKRRLASRHHRSLALMSEESDARDLNDPVRMYLSQMGTIPLLTRDEEIKLAKTIELMS
ncbi:MAG: sigma-70 factor domain-containing protein, partial [Planctomycetota bacterium]